MAQFEFGKTEFDFDKIAERWQLPPDVRPKPTDKPRFGAFEATLVLGSMLAATPAQATAQRERHFQWSNLVDQRMALGATLPVAQAFASAYFNELDRRAFARNRSRSRLRAAQGWGWGLVVGGLLLTWNCLVSPPARDFAIVSILITVLGDWLLRRVPRLRAAATQTENQLATPFNVRVTTAASGEVAGVGIEDIAGDNKQAAVLQ